MFLYVYVYVWIIYGFYIFVRWDSWKSQQPILDHRSTMGWLQVTATCKDPLLPKVGVGEKCAPEQFAYYTLVN